MMNGCLENIQQNIFLRSNVFKVPFLSILQFNLDEIYLSQSFL